MNAFGCALLILFLSINATAAEWAWDGFEILGNHSAPRAEIIKHIPVRVGDKYTEDQPAWKKWCEDLVTTFSFASAECSAVRFSDFKAYLVVDIVEKGSEYRSKFRKAPSQNLTLADKDIIATYDALQKRLWDLFAQGKPPAESWAEGFLDYSDSQMHKQVLELVKKVPAYRKNILHVLANDRDPAKRMSAADLLNWAGKGSKSVVHTHRLLDDPHSGVRNQLSRFMTHFVGEVHSDRRLKKVIDSILLQLNRTSHGDRNKALFNLIEIVRSKPALLAYIEKKGLSLIRYVAENSVLSNVAGPAKDLLSLMEASMKSEKISLSDGGVSYDAILFKVDKPTRLVLFAAGSGGNPERHLPLLASLATHGFTVIAPHFDRITSSTPTTEDLLSRARKLRIALDSISHGGIPVAGVGHSIGATILASMAGAQMWMGPGRRVEIIPDDRLKRLVLFTPPTGFFRAPSALDGLRIPVQVWAGTEDAITPLAQAEFMKQAMEKHASVDLRVIEGAGHFSFLNTLPPQVSDPFADRDVFLTRLAAEVAAFVER